MLTQKKPRLYQCERVFSDSSTTSPLRKEENGQEHPTLKRKSQNQALKVAKELDKTKISKKSKYKKLKSKQRKKLPFDSSSEAFGHSMEIGRPLPGPDVNENSMEAIGKMGAEEDNELA